MNTSPDHPDFTALALGEHIHGTPAQAVLEALRTSVAARLEAEQIQFTARQLSFVLKGQPPLRLDAARRNAILTADPEEVRARFEEEDRAAFEEEPAAPVPRPRRTWVYPTLAAAAIAVAGFVALRMLPGSTSPSQKKDPNPEVTGNGPDRDIRVTPGRTTPDGRPPAQKPTAVIVNQDPVPPPLPPQQVRDLPTPPEIPEQPPAIVKDTPPKLPDIRVPEVPPAPPSTGPAPAQADPSNLSDIPRKRDPGKDKKKGKKP